MNKSSDDHSIRPNECISLKDIKDYQQKGGEYNPFREIFIASEEKYAQQKRKLCAESSWSCSARHNIISVFVTYIMTRAEMNQMLLMKHHLYTLLSIKKIKLYTNKDWIRALKYLCSLHVYVHCECLYQPKLKVYSENCRSYSLDTK